MILCVVCAVFHGLNDKQYFHDILIPAGVIIHYV